MRAERATVESLVDAIEGGSADEVAACLAAGADPNAEWDGIPVLIHAVEGGSASVVAALLDAGARIEAETRHGMTGLVTAVADGAAAVVELLLARGADVHHEAREPDHSTPLICAINGGSLELVRRLLAARADPDQPRADGWTPLTAAAQEGDVEIVRALLDAGADVAKTNRGGWGPGDIADHWQREAVAALLRERGAPDPVANAMRRALAAWGSVEAWMAAHAPEACAQLRAVRGADAAEVDALECAVGAPLPADVRAYLLLCGGGGAPLDGYVGLDVQAIEATWRELTRRHVEMTFARSRASGVLQPSDDGWNPAWLPLARRDPYDLLCVDLSPPETRHRGRLLRWDPEGGPVGPIAHGLEQFLKGYVDSLLRSSGAGGGDIRSGGR